jgi:excisionase family DNA binding protein
MLPERGDLMPTAESSAGNDPRLEDVLTLPEVAAYLRVPEEAVLKLAQEGSLPAQRIGDEWRFLRKVVQIWLISGGHRFHREWGFHPMFWLESPFAEEMVHFIKSRVIDELNAAYPPKSQAPKAGSKQAVLRHFGIFKDDEDLEERLADAKKRREAT